MNTLPRRFAALVAASALALTGVSLVAAPATAIPPYDTRPSTVGADWLAGQLTNGLIHNTPYDFDDLGLTADTAFALAAVGGHASTLTAIGSAMAPVISNWYDSYGTIYTGSLAKAVAFVQAIGQDPTTFGGSNLVTKLEGYVASTGPIAGRIENQGELSYPENLPTDSANTIGQAFAAGALTQAGSTTAADATSFLLKQQCTAGFFRLYMTTDKAAPDQTCQGGRAAGASAPDPDATSTAIRMLLPQAGTSPEVARAVGKAEAWLLAQQHPDGSFSGGTSTAVPNANSTGLAGWVLGLLDDLDAAKSAAVWVRQHQADEFAPCTNALSGQAGAVAYDDAATSAGTTAGITVNAQDQWRRASSQSLPVLQWAPRATPALAVSGPSGYVRAGSRVSFAVTGVVPGDKVCLTGAGAPLRGAADAAGKVLLRPVMPAGTANRTLTVTDRAASTATFVAKVLGVKTLTVKAAKSRVKRGRSVTVVVTGLAPGELTKVAFRGRTVAAGKASSTGRYVATVKVGRRLGRATISAYGQFPAIRKGTTSIRVVR